MQPVPGDFTAEYVITVLEDAGRTLLALPITGTRPMGYRSNMPDIVRQFHEAYGSHDEPIRPPRPSARAISMMDETLGWVSLIPQEKFVIRRVVQCRLMINPVTGRHIYSWAKLAQHLSCDFRAAQRWHAEGIATIVARLNQQGLCAAAGGRVGPSAKLVAEALAHIRASTPAKRKPVRAVEFA